MQTYQPGKKNKNQVYYCVIIKYDKIAVCLYQNEASKGIYVNGGSGHCRAEHILLTTL